MQQISYQLVLRAYVYLDRRARHGAVMIRLYRRRGPLRSRPLEESKLIERARGGDAGSYGELVRKHQGIAFRAAYLITEDADEAEDAIQEAFTKAYRAMGRFRIGAPFRPWLLRIVANEARKRNRASRRRDKLGLTMAGDRSLRESAEPSAEEGFLASERRAELLEALGGLREEERLVICYRYFLDLPEKEAAEILGCAKGTIKSRISRAIERLRETLSAEARDTDATHEGRGGERGV